MNFWRSEKGAAGVVFALSLGLLLSAAALVVDYGRSAYEARLLQNAADSAALAAAHELPAAQDDPLAVAAVRNSAVEYASKNGYTLSPSQVSLEKLSNGKYCGVTVRVGDTVDYTLARIMGETEIALERSASVELTALGGVRNTVPIAVKKGVFDENIASGNYYMTLKYGGGNGDEGDYGAADLDGIAAGGANDYLMRLQYGYEDVLYVGDIILVESGNMSGPTKTGVTYRYNHCPHSPECTLAHYEPDCPRVMLVPVVHNLSKKQLVVDGFAPFFLDYVTGNGNKCEVHGTYIPGLVVSGEVGENPNAYGTYGRKLVS